MLLLCRASLSVVLEPAGEVLQRRVELVDALHLLISLVAQEQQLLLQVAHELLLRQQLRTQLLFCLVVVMHESIDRFGQLKVLRMGISAAGGRFLLQLGELDLSIKQLLLRAAQCFRQLLDLHLRRQQVVRQALVQLRDRVPGLRAQHLRRRHAERVRVARGHFGMQRAQLLGARCQARLEGPTARLHRRHGAADDAFVPV